MDEEQVAADEQVDAEQVPEISEEGGADVEAATVIDAQAALEHIEEVYQDAKVALRDYEISKGATATAKKVWEETERRLHRAIEDATTPNLFSTASGDEMEEGEAEGCEDDGEAPDQTDEPEG